MMKLTKIVLSVVFTTFIAISCGGGDGDGGGGGTGQVSQQSVDEFVTFLTDNVPGCTSQSLSASVNAVNINSILAAGKNISDRYSSLPAPDSSLAQTVGVPEDIPGICDTGTVSVTPTTESTTNIAGTINFNQCVIGAGADSVSINGPLTFSAQGSDVSSLDLSSLSASSNGITVSVGGESVTAAFNVSATMTSSSINATITSFSVTSGNQTYSLTNTNIQISMPNSTTTSISASGTYSDPVLGTFTFSTLSSGIVIDSSVPGSETVTGSLQINGSNSSQILVSIDQNANITFNGDADGDGSFDFSDTVNCSGIDTSGLPTL
jgi:hypothetical protein